LALSECFEFPLCRPEIFLQSRQLHSQLIKGDKTFSGHILKATPLALESYDPVGPPPRLPVGVAVRLRSFLLDEAFETSLQTLRIHNMLASWIGVPYEEVNYLCAGINHQAFFLEFRRGREDLYPEIQDAIQTAEVRGQEPVRVELMEHFGYFVTESSGHASEYAPYFRKSARMVEEELVPRFENEADQWFDFGRTGGYLRHCLGVLEESADDGPLPTERTHEYGSFIMEAMETNEPIKVNGNVPNRDLMKSLPYGCCVEVPCLVDANGVQPTTIDYYPPQLAALNRTNINVQELIVEAALTGDVEAVHHAVMLDPLTAAVSTLPRIRSMVDKMLDAQGPWLPQFQKAGV
jgi:alpha-galactosidase